MVAIQKAKRQFNVRNRHGRSQKDKERLGVLILVGVGVGLLWFLTSTTTTESSSSSSQSGGGSSSIIPENSALRFRKPHPQLNIKEEEDYDNEGVPARNDLPDEQRKQQEKQPNVAHKTNDAWNAMALDLLETLDCETIMPKAVQQLKKNGDYVDDVARRRLSDAGLQQHGDDGGFNLVGNGGAAESNKNLDIPAKDDDDDVVEDPEEEKWGREAMGNADMMNGMKDDPDYDFKETEEEMAQGEDDAMYFGSSATLTAQHLFCLAAMEKPPQEVVEQFSCKASDRKRRTLLDLWTAARAQIPVKLLKQILNLAREQKSQAILDRNFDLWAPSGDSGMTFMVNTLNNELRDTLDTIGSSLGEGKLFVDVGGGMGLTTLTVSQKYPGTKIISIEPASPNWLLQELNLRCNLRKAEFSKIKVILAGVGPNSDEEDDIMAKLMWRPTSTTSTRSWTPADEFGSDDVELLVRLRKLRSILAEADVYMSTPNVVDVLNLDCQGCEYNLIPSLSEEQFDAIPNVMGGVHWGYIPVSKLPSSERGRQTHERLCQHETIAKTTKECCAFLDAPVKSNIPGEVLYRDNGENKPPEPVSVSDIIQEDLCTNFAQWSLDHYLNSVPDDFGWFELSSQA